MSLCRGPYNTVGRQHVIKNLSREDNLTEVGARILSAAKEHDPHAESNYTKHPIKPIRLSKKKYAQLIGLEGNRTLVNQEIDALENNKYLRKTTYSTNASVSAAGKQKQVASYIITNIGIEALRQYQSSQECTINQEIKDGHDSSLNAAPQR